MAFDADVLVPIIACDFLLTAFDLGLFEPVVSAKVLDEVHRNLIENFRHLDRAAISWRVEAMRDALADHIIDAVDSAAPEAINAKDRHVVAAAIVGEAEFLTTNDARLRNEVRGVLPGIRPLSLDEFALELSSSATDETAAVIDALVAKRTNPPTTRAAMLTALKGIIPSAIDQCQRADDPGGCVTARSRCRRPRRRRTSPTFL